jgi:hypothetical protein
MLDMHGNFAVVCHPERSSETTDHDSAAFPKDGANVRAMRNQGCAVLQAL